MGFALRIVHKLLSSLHSETINQYWLGALFLTLVLSTISVVLSHLQQPRQHAGWRLISDLLVREQLAFLSYGFALYISAYVQAEQKALGPWFGILKWLGAVVFRTGGVVYRTFPIVEAA